MEELRLGKVSTRELASWFGLTYASFKTHPLEHYKKLQEYCQFERKHGYINITKIMYPYYCKDVNVRDIETYHTMIKMVPNKISSIKAMSEELDRRQLPQFQNLSMQTIQHRMSQAGKMAYGITKDEGSVGIYGYREYRWVVKTNRPWPNCYRAMTPFEQDVFKDLVSAYYSRNMDRVLTKEVLERRFRQDDAMTKEEYFDLIDKYDLDVFKDVIMKFMERTNLLIVCGTQHFDNLLSQGAPS